MYLLNSEVVSLVYMKIWQRDTTHQIWFAASGSKETMMQ